MSRVQSRERHPLSRPLTAESEPSQLEAQLNAQSNGRSNGHPNGTYPPITAHDHQPFTEDELSLALKRSHLAVPAQG